MVVGDVSFKYLDALHALEHLDKGLSTNQGREHRTSKPCGHWSKAAKYSQGCRRVRDRHT